EIVKQNRARIENCGQVADWHTHRNTERLVARRRQLAAGREIGNSEVTESAAAEESTNITFIFLRCGVKATSFSLTPPFEVATSLICFGCFSSRSCRSFP